MSNAKTNKQMNEAELLAKVEENTILQKENAALKLKEEKYINTIKEQGEELERLRVVAKVLENHFMENGPGWHVEKCVGCGKCDYVLLENSLAKANVLSK